jgi:hypothetical protein
MNRLRGSLRRADDAWALLPLLARCVHQRPHESQTWNYEEFIVHRRATIVRFTSLVSGSLLALGVLLVGSTAQAHDYDDHDHRRHERGKLMLALDLDYGAALNHSEVDNGGGAGLRIGLERDYFLITLIPELQLNYHYLNADRVESATITTGKIGGRIRFLKIVEPGIFAHAGLGHIGGDRVYEKTGIAFDAGFTLDLTILPLIDIGLHTAWNKIFGDPSVEYVTAGAHLALVL